MKQHRSFPTAALAALATLTLGACGDGSNDDHDHDVDAAVSPDAASPDAPAPDAPPADPDAGVDAPPPFVAPPPFAVPLSAAGPDQLQSAAAGPNGTFYAAGYAAATLAGTRFITVVQLSPTGLVAAFGGGDGVATTALDFRGGSDEVDVAVQSTGRILVSATVVSPTLATNRAIAVARLNVDGTPDTTFGVGGVRVLDLTQPADNNGTLTGFDGARGLAVGAGDIIYVHGYSRAAGTVAGGGPRLDTDYTVVKLGADGTQDLAFGGGDGRFTLDLQQSNATARGIHVLPDGTLIAAGYANTTGLGTTQPVLYKLTAAGELVTAFASGGVFHDTVAALQTEAYNVAIHGDDLVTAGYGRETGTTNNWISLRFNVTTGVRDLTWGGAAGGKVIIDPSGAMLGSNCRNAIALPGGKTALIGSTGPGNMPAQDAVFGILDATGRLDTAYGTGIHVFPLGANGANGNDQFWGGAVSGANLLVVGYKGGGATQTEASNDDAYGVIVALR